MIIQNIVRVTVILLILISSSVGDSESGSPEVYHFPSQYGDVTYFDTRCHSDTILIFIHGLPTSKEIFLNIFDKLPETYRLIALDLNNYGQSEKTEEKLSHKQRADVIDDFRESLGIYSFILVSHDLGSSVALDYMKKYPLFVDKMVIMSGPVYPDFSPPSIVELVRKPKLGRFLLRFFPRMTFRISVKKGLDNNRALSDELYAVYKEAYIGDGKHEALYDNLNWGFPVEFYSEYPAIMKTITVPALVIHGREDPYVPYTESVRMERDIPNSQLFIIENGSHFIPLDFADTIADEMILFIRDSEERR